MTMKPGESYAEATGYARQLTIRPAGEHVFGAIATLDGPATGGSPP
jgi:hypothetical protein